MKRRILSTLLALCMVLSMMPVSVLATDTEASTTGGLTAAIDTGAEVTLYDADGDGAYEIGTADELYAFAALVNGGSNTVNGELTADIVVNEGTMTADSADARVWIPIGNSSAYNGSFTGNGYTVSGLYLNGTEASYAGLFGCVRGSTNAMLDIQDLGLTNSYICGKNQTGGIVAYAENVNITNCWNASTICGTGGNVAGVVGRSNNLLSMTGCYNTGTVDGSDDATYVGGLIALSTATIDYCYNTGCITGGSTSCGGLVGYHAQSAVKNSYNIGAVNSSASYIGSLLGYFMDLFGVSETLTNCYYLTEGDGDGSTELPAVGEYNRTYCEELSVIYGISDFSTGEVCYRLNGDQSALHFYQTVGTGYPTHSGAQVYQVADCLGNAAYSNSQTDTIHVGGTATCATQAVCAGCGTAYGELNGENHETPDSFEYAVNADDATMHDKKYTCCGAIIETEAHPEYDESLHCTVCQAPESYGVYVGSTLVTADNKDDVVRTYEGKISYDPATWTLTLTDCWYICQSYAAFRADHDLTVALVGSNRIDAYTSMFRMTGGDLTITSTTGGSAVFNSYGDAFLDYRYDADHHVLTISDCTVVIDSIITTVIANTYDLKVINSDFTLDEVLAPVNTVFQNSTVKQATHRNHALNTKNLTVTDSVVEIYQMEACHDNWSALKAEAVTIDSSSHVVVHKCIDPEWTNTGYAFAAIGELNLDSGYVRYAADGDFAVEEAPNTTEVKYFEFLGAEHLSGKGTANEDETHNHLCPDGCALGTSLHESCYGGTLTCTEQAVCAVCGDGYGDLPVGHVTTKEATCNSLAVCSVCGEYGEFDPDEHTSGEFCYAPSESDSARHDKKYVCCGAIAETLNHDLPADDYDCTTQVVCTTCNAVVTEAMEHSFVDGECANDGCQVWQTFTMTYYVDGVYVHTETYTSGAGYTLWIPEEKEGMTFQGWATEENGKVAYKAGSYIWPDSDLSFYAVYGKTCAITYYSYDPDTCTHYEDGVTVYGSGETELATDYSNFYKIVGWDKDGDGVADYKCGELIDLTEDLTLYAVVEPFAAVIDLGAEDAVYDITAVTGELPYSTVRFTTFPTRKGYTFVGWKDDYYYPCEHLICTDEETGERYIEIQLPDDVTLTAMWEATPVTITKQPADVTAKLGEKISFTVEAEGEGLSYQWYYKFDSHEDFSVSCFKRDTYSITMENFRNGLSVYCVITDASGNTVTSDIARAYIPLEITQQPQDVQVEIGGDCSMTVKATGYGLSYQWYYKNLKGTEFKTSCYTGKNYNMVMREFCHGRQVYCVITDAFGNTVTTDTATMLRIPAVELVILTQPESVEVDFGENARIDVEVQGEGLTYQWYYKNLGSTEFKESSFTRSYYSMTMADFCDGRQVYCVITDLYGSTVTTDTVTMRSTYQELSILTQPEDVAVELGERFSVTVEAQGSGLSYQWYYKNASDTEFKVSGFRGDTYSMTLASWNTGRQVYCVITDRNGSTVTTETVTISRTAAADAAVTLD